MSKYSIKYYPVDNGDMSLITLSDDTTILIDCKISESSKEDENNKYDVRDDLLKSLKQKNNAPYVDIFVLTHPDQDHCLGFDNNFYLGDPSKYSESDKKKKKIIINELWFTPRVISRYEKTSKLCDDAKKFKEEALRRIKLHKDKNKVKDDNGNKIILIGYGESDESKGLDHIRYVPGTEVFKFNGKTREDFSFFIHAPFKEDLSSAEKDRNNSSVVVQSRFKLKKSEYACFAFFSGDADHYVWEKILDRTKKNNEELLKWDLFLAPHHCSWTFFNDTPYKDNKEPKKYSLEVLDYKRKNAKVIASCKEIINNDDNPPHYYAAEEYKKKVTKENFLVTSENPNKKNPKPIIFEISSNGPVRNDSLERTAIVSAGGTVATSTPASYGR